MTDGFMGRWIVETRPRPSFYLDPKSTNARRIFSSLNVDLVSDPRQANLVWLRRGVEKVLPLLKDDQLINHFVRESAMINKGQLTANLNAHAGVDFYPDSYRLYDAAECATFFELLDVDEDAEQIWILKPANLSKGQGIHILREFDNLRRQFVDGDMSAPVVDSRLEYIAQRYISQPLLLQGKKSELRIYWMILSTDPLLVLMFDEGTVRLTSQPFSLDDLENPLVHVTNTYQQKRHSGSDSVANLKWTFAELQRYLTEDLALAAPDFLQNNLKPQLKACLKQVALAIVDELRNTQTEATCFGVYGADVILDASLKPWITEIQKNPGLSHNDRVKINVVPEMLREAVQIALAYSIDDWDGLPGRFEWVIGP
jgi:hypothetical protein